MQNKGTTLLIVEDNHDLRNGLKDILSFEGFTVLAAANGREAINQMKAICPDLIISDITMPEMDGFEFFETVRSRPEGVTIPFIFLTARGERDDVLRGKNLGAEDYLVKPVTRGELVAAVQSRLTRFRQLQMAQMEQAYQAALAALANGIEVRDRYTRGHVERVTAYTLAIAEQLGWRGKRLDDLRYGAILHDIGKIFITEQILQKAGKLTEEERAEIMRHPLRGAEMVKDIPYLSMAIPVIRSHHERWDGSGYPEGLKGEEIPIEARIIAVADVFDALTSNRPYHTAATLANGYSEVVNASGAHFDPMVVNAFQRAWENNKIQEIAAKWANLPQPIDDSPQTTRVSSG
ncbi:MAG: response regulator [Anaerolineales bacterium]|nr:response regulator [Anaerolineales bacterium]